MRYEVRVVVDMATTWEADNKDTAIELADEWVRQEYGDLIHKATLIVKDLP